MQHTYEIDLCLASSHTRFMDLMRFELTVASALNAPTLHTFIIPSPANDCICQHSDGDIGICSAARGIPDPSSRDHMLLKPLAPAQSSRTRRHDSAPRARAGYMQQRPAFQRIQAPYAATERTRISRPPDAFSSPTAAGRLGDARITQNGHPTNQPSRIVDIACESAASKISLLPVALNPQPTAGSRTLGAYACPTAR
ncbi:hypothetical protein DENSPDRAFT_838903 [Dentipellis sp. KUC8613]|nr:hypothetical protein DENSPDRAFT_838903 [Dentipellis sp. KUC8613]